jgi:hypothetical protein
MRVYRLVTMGQYPRSTEQSGSVARRTTPTMPSSASSHPWSDRRVEKDHPLLFSHGTSGSWRVLGAGSTASVPPASRLGEPPKSAAVAVHITHVSVRTRRTWVVSSNSDWERHLRRCPRPFERSRRRSAPPSRRRVGPDQTGWEEDRRAVTSITAGG